jgi:hypothetical protein
VRGAASEELSTGDHAAHDEREVSSERFEGASAFTVECDLVDFGDVCEGDAPRHGAVLFEVGDDDAFEALRVV